MSVTSYVSGVVLPCEVDVRVVVNEDKQGVGVLFDFPHEGVHLGMNVGVQTHHILVWFLVGWGGVFDAQVHKHPWAKQRFQSSESLRPKREGKSSPNLQKLPSDTNLIVGCAGPSGVPGCEMEGPIPESPLYKNAPNQDCGSQSRRWSRLERGGSEPRSAGSGRSERPYLKVLLQENKEGESVCININVNLMQKIKNDPK